MSGRNRTLRNQSAGQFLHSLEEYGRQKPRQREDCSSNWRNTDAKSPVSGKIPPVTGRIRTLRRPLAGQYLQRLEESALGKQYVPTPLALAGDEGAEESFKDQYGIAIAGQTATRNGNILQPPHRSPRVSRTDSSVIDERFSKLISPTESSALFCNTATSR